MKGEKEIKCTGCGEIFIFRSSEKDYSVQRNIAEPRFCPICRKAFRIKKENERRTREDEAWEIKKATDFKQYEDDLKNWDLVSLSPNRIRVRG